jgi:hypothetical protein
MAIPGHHALSGAYLRVKRAGIHLADLEGRIKAFWESSNKKLTISFNLNTLELTPQTDNLPAIPAMLGVLVGEIIYNLRCALDYLVFELAILDSGIEQEMTQFLIEDTPKGWERRRPRYLRGLSVEHVAMIERLQPFPGRDDNWRLAALRDISNSDKHCQWLVVAQQIDGPIFLKASAPGSFEGETRGQVKSTVLPDGRKADVHMYGNLTAAITLADGTPIVETLHSVKARVIDILNSFMPEFPVAQNPPPEV